MYKFFLFLIFANLTASQTRFSPSTSLSTSASSSKKDSPINININIKKNDSLNPFPKNWQRFCLPFHIVNNGLEHIFKKQSEEKLTIYDYQTFLEKECYYSDKRSLFAQAYENELTSIYQKTHPLLTLLSFFGYEGSQKSSKNISIILNKKVFSHSCLLAHLLINEHFFNLQKRNDEKYASSVSPEEIVYLEQLDSKIKILQGELEEVLKRIE